MNRRIREEPPALTEPWKLGDLRAHWIDCVGAQLATISNPMSIAPGGAITVHCATANWAAKVVGMEREVLAVLPAVVDGVRVRQLTMTSPFVETPGADLGFDFSVFDDFPEESDE